MTKAITFLFDPYSFFFPLLIWPFTFFEWKLSLKERKTVQENYTDHHITGAQPTKNQQQTKAKTSTKPTYERTKDSNQRHATSLQFLTIWSTENPLKELLDDAWEATVNLIFSFKMLSSTATPLKHLEFLSFQMIQLTARKDNLHISLPLCDPIGLVHDMKWSIMPFGSTQEHPNQCCKIRFVSDEFSE